MEDISGIDDTPFSLGTVYYDRSCFYAMAGDSASALEYLHKSLGLRPDLAAWARQDTDLVSLHEDARFNELVADSPDSTAAG